MSEFETMSKREGQYKNLYFYILITTVIYTIYPNSKLRKSNLKHKFRMEVGFWGSSFVYKTWFRERESGYCDLYVRVR